MFSCIKFLILLDYNWVLSSSATKQRSYRPNTSSHVRILHGSRGTQHWDQNRNWWGKYDEIVIFSWKTWTQNCFDIFHRFLSVFCEWIIKDSQKWVWQQNPNEFLSSLSQSNETRIWHVDKMGNMALQRKQPTRVRPTDGEKALCASTTGEPLGSWGRNFFRIMERLRCVQLLWQRLENRWKRRAFLIEAKCVHSCTIVWCSE